MPPPPGRSPSFTSGWPNLAAVNRDPNRAGHRRLAAAAEREAIDRRDHGLAEVLDEIEDLLPETAGPLRIERSGMRELADVGARDERFVAGARQDTPRTAIVVFAIS